MPTFDILLPLGAIAFYLIDSVLLVYDNELLWVRRGPRWSIREGSDVRVLGKRLYLPNPLTPHALLFRVVWSPSDVRPLGDAPEPIEDFTRTLSAIRVLVMAQLIILLVLLPLVSWTIGADWPLLSLFALFYVLLVTALIVLYRRRGSLGLTVKSFWWLALDVLACAPFGVNLLRKISLRRSISGNPILFARAHFDADARRQLLRILDRRVREDLAREEDGAVRQNELQAFLDQLPKMLPCP
ncbi:MAG TPA: hypothetical protein VF931_08060 [Steroidobacteraceae bacterium]